MPANVTAAVDEFLERLEFPPENPRFVTGEVCRRLAQEMDRRPSATIARELHCHRGYMAAFPNEPAGFVDEIRMRRAQRRLEMVLDASARGGDVAPPDSPGHRSGW